VSEETAADAVGGFGARTFSLVEATSAAQRKKENPDGKWLSDSGRLIVEEPETITMQ